MSASNEFLSAEQSYPLNNITVEKKKRKRGRPAGEVSTNSAIYRSFHGAKGRCTNMNSKDWDAYGGRGIRFKLISVKALQDEIGEPPKGHSLDRIDPNGHYEPGNVRWASPVKQAKNRRAPHRSTGLANYKLSAEVWLNTIASVNKPLLGEPPLLTPKSDFGLFRTSDHAYVVLLPSLNAPGEKVFVKVGPPTRSMVSPMTEFGLLEGTENISLKANVSSLEFQAYLEFHQRGENWAQRGLRFVDVVHSGMNRIEGRMLAAAGQFYATRWRTKVLLSVDLVDILDGWDESPLFGTACLFLPDLEMWAEASNECSRLKYRLVEALWARQEAGQRTIIYFDPRRPSGRLRRLLDTGYDEVSLSCAFGLP